MGDFAGNFYLQMGYVLPLHCLYGILVFISEKYN